MCSYDRAPRFAAPKLQTSPNVGPLTYDPEIVPYVFEGFAPFLSTAPRSKEAKDEGLPGPAHYHPNTEPCNVPGGISPSFQAPRFPIVCICEDEDEEGEEGEDGEEALPAVKVCRSYHGKICRDRVPYTLQSHAPSIPLKNVAGYLLTRDGVLFPLVEMPHVEKDCPCPCSKEEKDPTKKYKGNFWSRMRGQRSTFTGQTGPGPADYDVEGPGPSAVQMEIERVRNRLAAVRATARKSLWGDGKKDIPGPGQYDVLGEERKKARLMKEKQHGAFLTSSKRFCKNLREGPAPCDTAWCICPCKLWYASTVPFLSSNPRFDKRKDEDLPGPAHYGAVDTPKCTPSKYSLVRVAFGSASRRDPIDHRKDLPGPADYTAVKEPSEVVPHMSPAFKSTVPRFKSVKVHDTRPQTLTYFRDVKKLKKTKQPFSSTDSRFSEIIPGMPRKYPEKDNPGPGWYNLEKEYNCKITYTISASSRFKYKMKDGPGPADYTLPAEFTHTCLRRTLNATLGNPLPRVLDCVPIRPRWVRTTKFLRCHQVGSDHCHSLSAQMLQCKPRPLPYRPAQKREPC